jgi:hypothetical protein
MMALENPPTDPLSESLVASSEVVALRITVAEKTTEFCSRDYASRLRAIVLTGSLARDEATWVPEAREWRLLGDAEFFLVFESGTRLPSRPALGFLQREIQSVLERDRIVAQVQLAPVYAEYFTELRPHIFAYELRTCALVVWGEASILALIPGFTAADIPLEDAWRLLANRMIELLKAVAMTGTSATAVPEGLRYRTAKLYLDMATSLLVFAGSYAPTYRERQRRLGILANTAGTDRDWPFPLGPFVQQVNTSTGLKLKGEWRESAALGWEVWRQGLQYARLLWRWELARLTHGRPGAEGSELMQTWMRRQPFAQRLRGWMFVWRTCGWVRGWRWWPRWARLFAGGSPRSWTYSAAYGLFCQLPEVLEAGGDTGASTQVAEEVMNCLPVVRNPGTKSTKLGWRQLVDEVVWNYQRFLEQTQA